MEPWEKYFGDEEVKETDDPFGMNSPENLLDRPSYNLIDLDEEKGLLMAHKNKDDHENVHQCTYNHTTPTLPFHLSNFISYSDSQVKNQDSES